MVYCDNCGSSVIGNFCQNCGHSMIQVAPQPYGPPAQPGRLPGKAIGAMILAIILVIILIAAMTLVWWTYSMEMNMESMGYEVSMEANADMKLDESSVDMKMQGMGMDQSQEEDVDLTGEEEDVGGTTRFFLILGIVMLCIVIFLLIIMMGSARDRGMSRYTKTFGNFALLFALLALIFMLIAPVYYMTAWPEAVQNDMEESSQGQGDEIEQMMGGVYDGSFIGSDSMDFMGAEIKSSWGPGLGWILALIAMVLGIILLIFVKLGRDEVLRTAPSQVYGPQQYGMGQPPQYLYQQQYQPPPQYPRQPPQYPY